MENEKTRGYEWKVAVLGVTSWLTGPYGDQSPGAEFLGSWWI